MRSPDRPASRAAARLATVRFALAIVCRGYCRTRRARPFQGVSAGRAHATVTICPVLRLPNELYAKMVGHCISGLPDEACGLLAGHAERGEVVACYPTRNAAASAKVYAVDSRDMLAADRDADSHGTEIIGVFHSHTHTDAYPSPTDVAQAPDPGWHYVLVSLRDTHPVVRSYTIVDGLIDEESVVVHTHDLPLV